MSKTRRQSVLGEPPPPTTAAGTWSGTPSETARRTIDATRRGDGIIDARRRRFDAACAIAGARGDRQAKKSPLVDSTGRLASLRRPVSPADGAERCQPADSALA